MSGKDPLRQKKRYAPNLRDENVGNYINCVLAVTEQSGIDDLLISEQPFDVYSVTGKMIRHQTTTLRGLPRGVYVICGQKVIVR